MGFSLKDFIYFWYTGAKKYWHPYLINPIELRSLWTEKEYIKSAARVLNRDCVNKKGLYISKEVLWVSVGQRAAEIRAVKVGGQQKKSANRPGSNPLCPRGGWSAEFFDDLQLWQSLS